MRQLWKAEPFRKFTLHLADGRDMAMHHREFLSMSPSGRKVILYGPDDSFKIVNLLLVTDPEVNGNARQGCKKLS